mmetsp:Transcript_13927/g.30370  ORF Transcript_13927/g.30370 Transcript_13927/m.30370 type:complete len:566 (+) Transcript_13927:110-1807(+)
MQSATWRSWCYGALGWRCSHLQLILHLLVTALSFIHTGAFHLPPPVLLEARTRCISVEITPLRQITSALRSSKTGKINGSDKSIEYTDQQPRDDIQNCDILCSYSHNVTEEECFHNQNDTKKSNDATAAKPWIMPLSPRHQTVPPVFLFPWSFWMKIRSAIPTIHHEHEVETGSQSKTNITKQKPKRRWEVPLTSKPYQCPEELRSTIRLCIGAVALYFVVGILVFPFWLEPTWTVIDAVYFSMASITTVGYGDVVVSGGRGARAMIAKLFVLSFNIYAVCISVSALGIIAKLALTQEKKIMARAKERARQQLIQMFDFEQDDEEGLEDEADEEDEQCRWADRVIDEKNKCDLPDEPRTIVGALKQAIQNNLFNFLVLAVIAGLLKRVERWSFIDVLYYWNCTATTIGFGDLCPQTQLGRLLAIVFIPLSVVTLGEVIASVFAFINSRIAAKAEKDFLRREITLSDLEYLDVNDDGKVCELDFTTFMLVAMQKVDRKTMKDLQNIFHALDAGKDGFLQKEDLIELRQRKRLSKRLIREARKKERWFETRLRKDKKKSKKWFGWSF